MFVVDDEIFVDRGTKSIRQFVTFHKFLNWNLDHGRSSKLTKKILDMCQEKYNHVSKLIIENLKLEWEKFSKFSKFSKYQIFRILHFNKNYLIFTVHNTSLNTTLNLAHNGDNKWNTSDCFHGSSQTPESPQKKHRKWVAASSSCWIFAQQHRMEKFHPTNIRKF